MSIKAAGLVDDLDLRALADAIQVNLRYNPRNGQIEGRQQRVLAIGEGLSFPAHLEVISSLATYGSASVLLHVVGDLGLMVTARIRGLELRVLDLSKFEPGPAYRGHGLFEHLGVTTARAAAQAVDTATVLVLEKLPGGAWRRTST